MAERVAIAQDSQAPFVSLLLVAELYGTDACMFSRTDVRPLLLRFRIRACSDADFCFNSGQTMVTATMAFSTPWLDPTVLAQVLGHKARKASMVNGN